MGHFFEAGFLRGPRNCPRDTFVGAIVSGAMAGWDPELFADERREAVEEGPLVGCWEQPGKCRNSEQDKHIGTCGKCRTSGSTDLYVILKLWSYFIQYEVPFPKMISQYESTGQMKRGKTGRIRFV